MFLSRVGSNLLLTNLPLTDSQTVFCSFKLFHFWFVILFDREITRTVKIHKNAQIVFCVGFYTPLNTNPSIKITSNIPLRSIFLKKSTFPNGVKIPSGSLKYPDYDYDHKKWLPLSPEGQQVDFCENWTWSICHINTTWGTFGYQKHEFDHKTS